MELSDTNYERYLDPEEGTDLSDRTVPPAEQLEKTIASAIGSDLRDAMVDPGPYLSDLPGLARDLADRAVQRLLADSRTGYGWLVQEGAVFRSAGVVPADGAESGPQWKVGDLCWVEMSGAASVVYAYAGVVHGVRPDGQVLVEIEPSGSMVIRSADRLWSRPKPEPEVSAPRPVTAAHDDDWGRLQAVIRVALLRADVIGDSDDLDRIADEVADGLVARSYQVDGGWLLFDGAAHRLQEVMERDLADGHQYWELCTHSKEDWS